MVVFTVSDGLATDQETVTLTVRDVAAQITALSVFPLQFSPNGDGQKDAVKFTVAFNHTVDWRIEIWYSDGSKLLRSFSGTAIDSTQTWDGNDSAGTPLTNGNYKYVVSGTDGGGSRVSRSGTVKLDTVAPGTYKYILEVKDKAFNSAPRHTGKIGVQ